MTNVSGAHGSKVQFLRAFGDDSETKSVRRHDSKIDRGLNKILKSNKSPLAISSQRIKRIKV